MFSKVLFTYSNFERQLYSLPHKFIPYPCHRMSFTYLPVKMYDCKARCHSRNGRKWQDAHKK